MAPKELKNGKDMESFVYISKCNIARVYDKSISSFLRKLYTDFSYDFIDLQSHQNLVRVFSLYPCQHLLSFEFMILAIHTRVRRHLKGVLPCIFLMVESVENFKKIFLIHLFFFSVTSLSTSMVNS